MRKAAVKAESAIRRLAAGACLRATQLRRILHAYPELSGHERRTASRIGRELTRVGLRPRYYVGRTGVAAELDCGPGPCVVLRADTDALPIQELNDVPFRSRARGVMHACGHDMHTAILLGAAAVLWRLRHRLRGRIVFLFQPSEELEPGGAIRLIREGAFPRSAAAVFGLHVSADHPCGAVGIKPGSDGTGVLAFEVTVHGRGGHGAMPEKTIDPIACAAAMIPALRSLAKSETARGEPVVITVGSFHAGAAHNVIPDDATFAGTVRTYSRDTERRIGRRIRRLLASAAARQRARVTITFRQSYPPGHNDPALARRALRVLTRQLGKENAVRRTAPCRFAEDFAYYQNRAPGVFVHLGVRPPAGPRQMPGIHSAHFLPDERAIRTGIEVHCALALDIMLGA